MIKEELQKLLDEDFPKQEEWWPILQDCMKSGKSEEECVDLATQVYGGNYDDQTIFDYMEFEYGDKFEKPPKPEGDEINDWITASRQEAEKWDKFYNEFGADIKWRSNDDIAATYYSIFGEYPGSRQTKRLKRKVAAWRRKKGLEVDE